MSSQKDPIRPGDRYVKVDDPSVVWVVERILSLPNLPPHLHLSPEGVRNRKLTFSVSALQDEKLFQKLEPPCHPE